MSLRPVELHLLLALSVSPLHGYALVHRIDEDSEGRMRLLPGNLYTVIRRLEADGLVAESPKNPAPAEDTDATIYRTVNADLRLSLAAQSQRALPCVQRRLERSRTMDSWSLH